MSTKRYKPEQVVNLLRQIEVEIANGKTTPFRPPVPIPPPPHELPAVSVCPKSHGSRPASTFVLWELGGSAWIIIRGEKT